MAQRRLRGRDARQPGDLSFAPLRQRMALEDEDGSPAGRLADEAGVSPATVTGMLDTLEAIGVVTRERSERDRRVVLARLTADGRRLRDEKRREVRAVFEEALATLDPAELGGDVSAGGLDGRRQLAAGIGVDADAEGRRFSGRRGADKAGSCATDFFDG